MIDTDETLDDIAIQFSTRSFLKNVWRFEENCVRTIMSGYGSMKFTISLLVFALVGCVGTPGEHRSRLGEDSPAQWKEGFPRGFFAVYEDGVEHPLSKRESPNDMEIPVVGSVRNEGSTFLPPGSSLLDAIIAAGGAYGGGHLGGAYAFRVERSDGSVRAVSARGGPDPLKTFVLEPGDTVFAPQ